MVLKVSSTTTAEAKRQIHDEEKLSEKKSK